MGAIFETFGKYRLTERLAFGGMAEVFLATVHGEAGFVKPVVIKRLHPRLSEDAEFVNMLIDEARITAQLAHSNICQVLDLGSVAGAYYLAMEYISGEDLRTLQDHCKRQGTDLPVEAALHIVSEALAGLDYAHRKEGPDGQPLGVIHRDISPQNILISYEGEVKVIDFGIAKARSRLVQTEAGVIKGKFRYMSPEQASGGVVDHRTDVFAAGVVLYELLRGEPHLMNVPDTEVLRRMRRAEFEPLRETRPEIPVTLEKLVRRALSVKAGNRYPTAGQFRDALQSYMQQARLRFGRAELAAFMQQIFDADRRRRRSGSFSGRGSAPPRSPATATPAVEITAETDIYDRLSNAAEEPARGRSSQESWEAYAPTTAARDLDAAEPPVASPDEPSDDAQTLAYRALEEEEGETGHARAAPAGSGRPPAASALPRVPTDVLPEPSQQLHVQPTALRHRDRSRMEAGGWTRSESRERSLVKSAEQPASAPEGGALPPTGDVATGFFVRQAETAQKVARPADARPRTSIRTLLGLSALVVLGLGLVLALNLFEAPLDVGAEPDAQRRLADLSAVRPDARRGGEPPRRRTGWLVVRSEPPGAQITLCDAATAKTTPARLAAPAGTSCTLELRLEGYETYQLPVAVQAGRATTLVAKLRRVRGGGGGAAAGRGTLRVTSIQVGTVYVDDREVGSTPRLDLPLLPGTYRVRVFFPTLDRRSRVHEVAVRAGQTTRVHIDPSP